MKKTTINLLQNFGRLLKSIWMWITDHKFWSAFILAVILGIAYWQFAPAKTAAGAEEITVTRKNLEEAVSLTGRVKPTEEAAVTFEKSGTVRAVNVKAGDRVYKGQTLATLSADDVYARVAEAQANLNGQIAMLDDLNSGAKEEQINLKRITIEKSQNDIDQAYRNIDDTLRNVSITANDLVRVTFQKYFDGSYNSTYRINTNSCNSQLESIVSTDRSNAETAIMAIEKIAGNYSTLSSQDEKDSAVREVRNNITTISTFLNNMKSLFSSECLATDTKYDATRSSLTVGRNTLSANQTDLASKISTINSLKITLKQAQEDLKLIEAGEKSEKVRQQEASVAASRARLSQAASEAAKNSLRAPFNGVITAVDIKAGEFASVGGAKSISLISDASFEIESKVSEVDVAKIKLGDTAKVTFDAYGDSEKFEAAITNISPAGVITEGVPTYKTIFSFTTKDERIRSGMTANIDVVTKIHENVIALPARAVKNVSGEKKVSVKTVIGDKSETTEKVVKTGARGTNGEVEITEGLTGGEIVVIDNTTK